MFSGIIERTLAVASVADGPKFRRLVLPRVWDDVQLGQSIAVNGVCLTIAELSDAKIHFDVIAETLAKTNLGSLEVGDAVNVERSLRVGDRIDGHFVQGHVDATGIISDLKVDGKDWRFTIQSPDELLKYLAPKGSITIDGVSLTIASVNGNHFDVALIPTTLQLTTLGKRQPGWRCNLEADVLTKSVVNVLERSGVLLARQEN